MINVILLIILIDISTNIVFHNTMMIINPLYVI